MVEPSHHARGFNFRTAYVQTAPSVDKVRVFNTLNFNAEQHALVTSAHSLVAMTLLGLEEEEELPHVRFVVNYGTPSPGEYTQRLCQCCHAGGRALSMAFLTRERGSAMLAHLQS